MMHLPGQQQEPLETTYSSIGIFKIKWLVDHKEWKMN